MVRQLVKSKVSGKSGGRPSLGPFVVAQPRNFCDSIVKFPIYLLRIIAATHNAAYYSKYCTK